MYFVLTRHGMYFISYIFYFIDTFHIICIQHITYQCLVLLSICLILTKISRIDNIISGLTVELKSLLVDCCR